MSRRRADDPQVLAAVDLGSNSFHMVVARFSHGQLTVIDRLREMVRLASGLDQRRRLDADSQARALACLSRFGERLRDMQVESVRVVGTNTLRRARNTERFRQRASRLLGHPVEVISGIEEARLIYVGATHHLPLVDGTQLIVDIGGGSTEIVAGQGFEPERMESLYIGCVGLSERCFRGGRLTSRNFEQARLAARLELEPVRTRYLDLDARQVAGTSGTIRAAHAVLGALGIAPRGITLEGLERLIQLMIEAGQVTNLKLPELPAERVAVFPGGVSILAEVMASLGTERMVVSEGALREGLLYDMIGRLTNEDARVRSVRALASRYHVDIAQADRVEATALMLLEQVAESWGLDIETDGELLSWAARLHEAGLDIAHSHYQRHGAYLIENADLPGFPRDEQRVVACMVNAHRRRLQREAFKVLPRPWIRRAFRLAVVLRLAVLFHRSRTTAGLPGIRLRANGKSVCLRLPAAWLDANPLTLAELEREQGYLADGGLELSVTRR